MSRPWIDPAVLEKLVPTRTLANVLLEIEQCNRMLNATYNRLHVVGSDRDEEDRLSEVYGGWDDKRTALRDEAIAMIQAATGVSWDAIREANL